MATVLVEAQISPALLSQAARAMTEAELRDLESSLRTERLRRLAPGEEETLLLIINQPLPHTERFAQLAQKWENGGLSEAERAELLALVGEREAINVARVEAVLRLSELRALPFDEVWHELMGEAPAPLHPAN